MSKKILNEDPILLEEVVKLLEQRDEEAPLNYIQRVTLDYARRFSKDFPQQKEFIEKIIEEFDIPKDKAIQIVNISASKENEVELVLGRDFSKKTKEKIAKLVEEHLKAHVEELEEEEEEVGLDDF